MKVKILWKVTLPPKAGSPREFKHLECEAERGLNFGDQLFKSALIEKGKHKSSPPLQLMIEDHFDQLHFTTKKPLLIEGVAKAHGSLKKGQRFKYLNHTFQLLDIQELVIPSITKPVKPKRKPSDKKVRMRKKGIPKKPFRISSTRGLLVGAGLLGLAVIIASVISGRYFDDGPSLPIEGGTSVMENSDSQDRPGEETAMAVPELAVYNPGDGRPDFSPDVLFIHAHPDDETLDFGCFLSWCEANGLSTAVLLLTDGESGLDYYPHRPVGGIYPDYEMEGEELAAVRRQEAFGALQILGADAYFRWGLTNHPYNGTLDRKGPENILDIWQSESLEFGGLDDRLARFINDLNPRILVSADGPDKPHEHFEHEAAGLLVRRGLDKLKSRYPHKMPELHLSVIDPRQADLYEDKIMLSSYLSSLDEDQNLRENQLEALMAHKTQRDSVTEGATFLPEYPGEYYLIQSGQGTTLGWPDIDPQL